MKDLIRYLRRDGENRAIRKHLGESNIVENDLVPILTKFSDDLPLFDATLRYRLCAKHLFKFADFLSLGC